MTTNWRRYLLLGVALTAGQAFLPAGVGRDVTYSLLCASGVVAIFVGVRSNRPAHAVAWYLLAAGLATWILGGALRTWYQYGAHTAPDFSLADVPQLASYPLFALGLWVLVRANGPERGLTELLDTLIVMLGVGLLSWVYLIEPLWHADGVPELARLVGAAYPLGGVLFVAMLVRFCAARGIRNAGSLLMGIAVSTMLAAELLTSVQDHVPALAAHPRVLTQAWLLVYVLWGTAALHPSMHALSVSAPSRDESTQVPRQLGLAAAAMAGPVVLMSELVTGRPLHAWSVAIASTVLVLLVLARMLVLVGLSREQSDRLGILAETDYVTGLADKHLFTTKVAALLEPSKRSEATAEHLGAVLLISLERLAEIDSTLGERTVDAILHGVGARLGELAGDGALVARLGDHAFGVLDPTIRSGAAAERAADRIQTALQCPFELPELPELSIAVEVSVGAVLLPDDADDADDASLVLRRAQVALIAAKLRPGRTAHYGAQMETGGALGPLLIGELRGALERKEIRLHYQPQVDLATGRVLGVEALARWQHPVHGLVPPDSFIAAAEQTGLIGPLTEYVLDRALAQCARWRREGLVLSVAVNLSVRNLLDPGLVDEVRSALHRHGLQADALELEITEGTAMVDPRRSLTVLGELAAMGVTLSIDDYGTGHSSLAYLQRMPVQRLKIDQSFIFGLLTDSASAAIVASTIELARHLRLDVVAEGVEDDATLLALRDMHCPTAQGFGLGRPVAPALLPALVEAIERRVPVVLATAVRLGH